MTLHSSLASVRATRDRLSELGLTTKKYLGQHFLIDDNIVGRILRLADVQQHSSVVEVGPGIGTLTEALLTQDVELTAVELDDALLAGLTSRFPQLQLLCGDALSDEIINRLREIAPASLVANLPYAVAATIVLEYLERLPSLQSATVMVQREVAQRMMASPETKEYGSYTIKLNLLAEATGQFSVSPQSFYPPPRVSSTVVRLKRRELSESPLIIDCASMLADAAFFQRRKTIRNSMRAYFLAHDLDPVLVDELLTQAGVDPQARGEALLPDVYLALGRIFSDKAP